MPHSAKPVHIRLEHLALQELPAGGEARLRREIARELELLLGQQDTCSEARLLPPHATQAQRIAEQIRRALPPH